MIPWADKLTFRTDQTRYRRDHAKYLSLIASVTLLHQYQRQETTRMRDGVSERCVVATLEDLEVANRLASATLAPRLDALLPQTRQLLEQLRAYVTERAAQEQVPCSRAAVLAARSCAPRSAGRIARCGGSWRAWWSWNTSSCIAPDAATRKCISGGRPTPWTPRTPPHVLGLTDAAHLSRRTTLSQGLLVPQSGDSALDPVEPAPNRHRIGTGNGANRHRAKSTSSRDL